MNIVYYITGHGYGHTVRSIEIIKALLGKNTNIFVRTSAPQWLFNDLNKIRYYENHLDFGAIQQDSFSIDKQQTLEKYADLISNKDQLLTGEINFLKENKINLVVSDIIPFAFDAAKETTIPAIAVGNFSWDWIYQAWISEYHQYKFVIDDIQQSYKKADILLRLPFYGDMSVFPKIKDVSLVGRKASMDKTSVLQKLGLHNHTKKIVLLALREQDLADVNWEKIESITGYTFISSSRKIKCSNIQFFQEGLLPFQDILNACDMVISKPGYGIVSETIINQTPILYIPRKDFAEEKVLQDVLQKECVSEKLLYDDFKNGAWEQSLKNIAQKPIKWAGYSLQGAAEIAGFIFKNY